MNKTVRRLLWAGAGIAAVAAVNNAVFARAKALGNPLGGEGRFWPGPYGDVFYTRQGQGDPVVLLHGLYPGGSVYEWRKNFDTLSEHFAVYAPDWLGFGLSDKPRIRYTAALYIEQLKQFLLEVVGRPCTVIASGVAGAYAIQAASEIPDIVSSLFLICPTGIRRMAQPPEAAAEPFYQTLHAPLVGTSAYNVMTSVPSLRHTLMNRVYFDPSYADDALIDHYSTASHQYGSQNALPALMTGMLNHDVSDVFSMLPQKTIRVIWGREARMTPLSDAEAFLAGNPNAELTVFDKCGSLPHDEQAQAVNRLIVDILTDTRPKAADSQGREKET
jgi:pimeloyl-ACP methyl ester carboxylesterase